MANVYPVRITVAMCSGTGTSGYNRRRFLHESLQDLDNSFKKLGGRLYVFEDKPTSVFKGLFDVCNWLFRLYEATQSGQKSSFFFLYVLSNI